MMKRRNGTLRNERPDKNLLDHSFKIDQRSFAEILGYIASFLEKINYYDLENKLDDNWKTLIESDPVIYMVLIIHEPLLQQNDLADKIVGKKEFDQEYKDVVNDLLRWYNKVNNWHKTLLILGEDKLSGKIKNILTSVLECKKNTLQQFVDQCTENTIKVEDLALDKAIYTFQTVLILIRNMTKEYLKQHLLSRNDHMPNNAMYIAFAILFKNLQRQINALSQKHLDFYYKDILQQKIRKGLATKTVVSFDLLPTVQSSFIEEGIQLTAGKLFESKTDIVFKTEKPIVAYNVELKELQTLLFITNSNIKIGTNKPLIFSIQKKDLVIGGKHIEPQNEWFAFGANKRTLQNTQVDSDKVANMGFVIGSPVLFLSEGVRTIRLQVNMQAASAQSIFWNLLGQMKVNCKLAMDIVFDQVFAQSLKVSYSTKKGWVTYSNYAMEYSEMNNSFTIVLKLDTMDYAIEQNNKVEENIKWPSIKVELNEYSPVYVYSFWKDLIIDTIDIDVDVKHVRDLSIYNNMGKMPLGKPFELFGPTPAVGSYLMLGKSELFKKDLTDINIRFEWDNIPLEFGGFNTYYDGYSKQINNNSFKVQLSVLLGSFWIPFNTVDTPKYNLFSTSKTLTPEGYATTQLNKEQNIHIERVGEFEMTKNFLLSDPLKYEVTSQSGFYKFTLVEPKEAFGADLYQKDYVKIATYNALNDNKIPYPNKPFIPKVKGVSVDYKASDTLIFSRALSNTTVSNDGAPEFMHVTPFGTDKVIYNQMVCKNTLVCNYDKEGYLFMGITGINQMTTLTIFFHLLQSSTGIIINERNLHWEYFRANKWHTFKDGNILQDKTNGFVKSGIVELILCANENDTLDDVYWIRVSTPTNSAHYPQIKGIYFNVVEAICTNNDEGVVGKEVPMGSINKLAGKYPDIKKVHQLVNSYGGLVNSSKREFYASVSERLRHKGRTVSIWDYERLILERYKDVHLVKCTNLDASFIPIPGVVKVVVLSNHWSIDERLYFDAGVLSEMQQYLKQRSSPFVKIQVINPTVEYVLANCVVCFEKEDNGGYYLKLLNEKIREFLSPMTSFDNHLGGIGGSVIPAMLVSFLEHLPYVKSIKQLNIEHIVRDDELKFSLRVFANNEAIKTTKPWAIFSPVSKNRIRSVLEDKDESTDLEFGLGDMSIEMDFIIDDVSDKSTIKTASSSTQMATVVAKTNLPNDALLVFKNKE